MADSPAAIFDIPVKELVKEKGEMIAVQRSTTVAQVMDTMLKKKVMSLPVLDSDTQRHYTLVSMSRVVGFLLNFEHGSGEAVDVSRLNKTVEQMLEETRVDAEFHLLEGDAPAHEAMRLLSTDGFNRVMVLGSPPKLLTQTDLIALLRSHPSLLPGETLASLGFTLQAVHCVKSSNTALACFREMYRHRISAAPIVDANGCAVGNISASDLRHVDPIHFNGIMLKTVKINVLDFLRGQHDGEVPAPIFVRGTDTMMDAAEKIQRGGIHRVWVLDDEMKPIGLVTITDIISAALRKRAELSS